MRLITILIATVIFVGCKNQREQIEKFGYDNNQTTSRKIHKYEFYSDGKIKIDYSEMYYFFGGAPLDTLVSKELFTYNSKGKAESIVNLMDSTKRLKTYNEIDSLIGDLKINQDGDTTFLTTTDYDNGKIVRRVNRILVSKFPKKIEDIKKEDFRNYDTLMDIMEVVYNGEKVEKSILKDSKGNVISEDQNIYEDEKLIKIETYSFLGSTKYLSKTTKYIYNNGKLTKPDEFTIGVRSDTIFYHKTVFQEGMRITISYFGEMKTQDINYYNEQNRNIGNVLINLVDRTKQVYAFKYDDKGNVTEETNYKVKLSNAR